MSTAANSTISDHSNIDIDIAMGTVDGIDGVNKFGHAPSGVQTTITDIWSRADATPTQQIWLAPTAPRIHTLVSDDAEDDALTGDAAKTVRVWGLPDWDTHETFEDVDMDGAVGVAMTQAMVIMHRMSVIDYGVNAGGTAGTANAGNITATAATDGTISAVIEAGVGQTEMAIYGVPSCCTFLMESYYATMRKSTAGATVGVDLEIRYNPLPATVPTGFINKHHDSMFGAGTTALHVPFAPPKPFVGPGIIKIMASSTAADTDVSGGFNGKLITNSAV